MASLYCAGPATIFITGPGNVPVFFGTCEDTPDLTVEPKYRPVKNALGGVEVPFDMSYQGEVALGSLELNRWNESVFSYWAARPKTWAASLPRGTNSLGDLGTLVLTEGYGLGVWIRFEFGITGSSPKQALINAGLPAGYRFPACIPVGPDKLGPLSTENRKIHLAFIGLRVYNLQAQTFTLYDSSMTGLPSLN